MRSRDGRRRYFDVEHPIPGPFRVPAEWTDRGAPTEGAIGPAGFRAEGPALLQLARLTRSIVVSSDFLDEETRQADGNRDSD